MNEYYLGVIWSLKILSVLVASTVYWIGGRPNGRLYKRILAPLALIIGVILTNLDHWNNWYLLAIPLYINWPHIGYGGKKLWFKIFRRTIWSLLYCSAALVFTIHSGAWLIFGVQVAISLICSVAFGVFNPFKSAPAEEGTIWFASNFLLPFML